VDEKEAIRRLYFIRRHSIRQIARERHHSRKTIRKALMDPSVPQYHLSAPKPCPVIDPFKGIIETWLEQDRRSPRKQRHTAHRIYDRLVAEYGFSGSERTVRHHVSKLRMDLEELAIPLEFDPGADAQCDWGEVQVYMDDEPITAQAFCMKLSCSGKPFVMAFPTQRQEAFFEGHDQAFHWFDGVPARVSYDNLATAVRKVLQGRNRQEQQAFTAFRSHYLFESHFATPGRPREQGRVESLVGYMRRNYFVPVPRVSSFAELNELLLQRLAADDQRGVPGKGVTVGEAWEEEKAKLLPLPHFPHRCCVSRPVKANRLSLVSFDSNRYSVPVEYGLSRLTLHAHAWRIEIACGDRVVAVHERCYGKDQDVMQVDHYLPLLLERPGAFPYARPVRRWDMPDTYRQLLDRLRERHNGDGVRQFLRVLMLGRICGAERLDHAIGQALEEGRADYDRVRQLAAGDGPPGEMPASRLAAVKVVLPDLSQYDRLRHSATSVGRPS
jgi:transposase